MQVGVVTLLLMLLVANKFAPKWASRPTSKLDVSRVPPLAAPSHIGAPPRVSPGATSPVMDGRSACTDVDSDARRARSRGGQRPKTNAPEVRTAQPSHSALPRARWLASTPVLAGACVRACRRGLSRMIACRHQCCSRRARRRTMVGDALRPFRGHSAGRRRPTAALGQAASAKRRRRQA
jgi:hypothetical protein